MSNKDPITLRAICATRVNYSNDKMFGFEIRLYDSKLAKTRDICGLSNLFNCKNEMYDVKVKS